MAALECAVRPIIARLASRRIGIDPRIAVSISPRGIVEVSPAVTGTHRHNRCVCWNTFGNVVNIVPGLIMRVGATPRGPVLAVGIRGPEANPLAVWVVSAQVDALREGLMRRQRLSRNHDFVVVAPLVLDPRGKINCWTDVCS